MLSSVVKTAPNGPANNALFVLDKERRKPDAKGQEAQETLLVTAYIHFFIQFSGLTVLEIFVLTVV